MLSPAVKGSTIIGCPLRQPGRPCIGVLRSRQTRVRVNAAISDFSPEFAAGLASSTASSVNLPDKLASLPPEVLLGAGAAAIAVVGLIAYVASTSSQAPSEAGAAPTVRAFPGAKPKPVPRENAVLVFGATGKLGRLIVAELLKAGRTVVAAVRDSGRALSIFQEAGLTPGLQSNGAGLIVDAGVDITDQKTLEGPLWSGISQVVLAVGPVFGRLPEGQMGYLDDMTSERVDAQGVSSVASAAKDALPKVRFNSYASWMHQCVQMGHTNFGHRYSSSWNCASSA
eukprot:jgi/Botrbrau1/19483/Bobra.0714s0001.1